MSTQEQNTSQDAHIKYSARERFGKGDEYIEHRGAFYAGAEWAFKYSEITVNGVLENFINDYNSTSLCNTETVVVQYIEIIANLYHEHIIGPVACLNGINNVLEFHNERIKD